MLGGQLVKKSPVRIFLTSWKFGRPPGERDAGAASVIIRSGLSFFSLDKLRSRFYNID